MLIRVPSHQTGSVLLLTMITTGVMALALASYLVLIDTQSKATLRSLSWNSGVPVAEAGIEEAMTQINYNGTNQVANNGWTLTQGKYFMKTRMIDGQPCIVGISTSMPPVIVAQGKVPAPMSTNLVSRTIKVCTGLNYLFSKGMVARLNLVLNGNNINVDSFDSSDPNYSTNGIYDPNKRKDNATVATNSGDPNMFSTGNANIWGRIATGPGGLASAGPNSCVGSNAWHLAGSKGIQPGMSTDDMDMSFWDIVNPVSLSSFAPSSGTVGGTNYDLVIPAGDSVITGSQTLGGKVIVTGGKARVWVTTDVQFSGSDFLYIAPGASLELYVSAPKASIGGLGVQNDTGVAANFIYYGMPSNTSLSYSGNAGIAGAIYAPNANFTMGGGGQNVYDFAGACVTRTITMNGKFNFHFDEALMHVANSGFIASSWDEIHQTWDDILAANVDLEQVN